MGVRGGGLRSAKLDQINNNNYNNNKTETKKEEEKKKRTAEIVDFSAPRRQCLVVFVCC